MDYKERAMILLDRNQDERLDKLVYHFIVGFLGDKVRTYELQESIASMVREIDNVKYLSSIYSFVDVKHDKELERKSKNELLQS